MDPISCIASGTQVLLLIAGIIIPSPPNSNFPRDGIYLVGLNTARSPSEDGQGEFEVTIRDGANVPMQGANVTVNFNACGPDIRLSRIQSYPGTSIACNGALGIVTGVTDIFGQFRFRILGGASNAGNGPGVATECAVIRVNGVFLSQVGVAALDQTGGLDGMLANDLSVIISDVNSGSNARRSDFTFDDQVRPDDVSRALRFVNLGGSPQNTGALCP